MSLEYQAILFDCDGVIVDTETLSNRLMHELLLKRGIDISTEVIHNQFTGYTTEDNLKTIETLTGVRLGDEFLKDYKAEFKSTIDQSLEPIEGIPSLLAKISIPIAMATNAKRQEMDYKLEKLGLIERFATRFCIEDVDQGKPAPDMYLKAAKALNTPPEHCIVIEDSIAGITAGVAAGSTVLAYSASVDPQSQIKAGATATFASMKELEKLLSL